MGKLFLFIGGVVFGGMAAFGGVIYLDKRKLSADDQLIFAPKNFYDSKEPAGEFAAVYISGTLTGKNLAYPNNTYAVSCYGTYKACFVAYVEQIGQDQIGRMQNPAAYPIVKMNQYEVIAQEEASLFGCYRVTLTIDRKAEQLLWVEEPINQTKPNCKDADTTTRKYSIEDSPRWKQFHTR